MCSCEYGFTCSRCKGRDYLTGRVTEPEFAELAGLSEPWVWEPTEPVAREAREYDE